MERGRPRLKKISNQHGRVAALKTTGTKDLSVEFYCRYLFGEYQQKQKISIAINFSLCRIDNMIIF